MNKKLAAVMALAILIAGGAGYAVYGKKSAEDTSATPSGDQAAATPENSENVAEIAPAAEDTAKEEKVAEAVAPEASKAPDDATNPVVARVNGEDVRRDEVLAFMQTLPPQMKQLPQESIFPMVIEQVVSGKIVDQKALAANLAASPEVNKRLDEARTQIVRAVYAEKAIEEKFSDSKVKEAYDKMVKEMPKVEEVQARHILVDDEKVAKDIIAKLDGGAKFEDLAKEFSKDKSNAGTGGDLGYFAEGDMVKEFSDAAFALSKDGYTKAPVKTQFGFHVIQQLDKRARPAPKYDDVKGQLAAQVRHGILNDLVSEWRKGASYEVFDFNGKPLPKEAPKEEPKAEEKPADKPAE